MCSSMGGSLASAGAKAKRLRRADGFVDQAEADRRTGVVGRRDHHHLQPLAAVVARRAPAGRPAARARRPARRGRTRSRRATTPSRRTRSFRCFSPTRRCDTTSTSSLKVGGSKPWPQTSRSSVATVSTRSTRARADRRCRARASAWRHRAIPARPAAAPASKVVEVCSRATVQPAAIAWPPKRSSTPRMPLGHQVERVAQMEARDRAARALERRRPGRRANTKVGRCKRSLMREATMPTTPSWKSASNTAMAAGGVAVGANSVLDQQPRPASRMPPSTSRRSRLMPSSVRASSCGAAGVVGQQAFDAERHVGQPPGGVDARAEREAEVEGARAARIAPGDREQRGDARLHAAGADALQALRDQAAVVARRAARRRPRCRARPGRAARRAAAGSPTSNTPRARSSARSASST